MTDLEKKLFDLAVGFRGCLDETYTDALADAAEAVRMERIPADAKANVLAAMVDSLRARERYAEVIKPYRGVWSMDALWKEAGRLRDEEDTKKD